MDAPLSPRVALDRVTKSYDGIRALDEVTTAIAPGGFVAVIGRSGAGKTTLLRCLSGATTVTVGRIRFDDQDLAALGGRRLARHRARVGMVYQQFNLVKRLGVLDNVLVGRLPHLGGWHRWAALARWFDAADREIAFRCLAEALKFKKAEVGWLGPKAYVEATTNNYANVDAVAQVRSQNGSLGYRSCLIVHADSDIFTPEDIGGKSFAFNDPNSTSGYLVPMTFFLNELGIEVKRHFSKLTFSGSHEASILAVANKKVDVASTNLPDLQQLTREGKVPRGALRVIWVSKLIPNDPVVVRKDLPATLRSAIQESLVAMKAKDPDAFAQAGAFLGGGFAPADDSKYQVVREMNEAAKKLAAPK